MHESFIVGLRRAGKAFPIDRLTPEGLVFGNETDARPRKWSVGFWPRSPVTEYRTDRIRTLRGWAAGEFKLKVRHRDGAIRFEGDDADALPSGHYYLRLQVDGLKVLGGRLRLDLEDGKETTLKIDVEEDRRQIALTTDFDEFDPDILRPLDSQDSKIDGLAVGEWLQAASPRATRKACLLNLMAKLRASPDSKNALVGHLTSIFFADVDRVYAAVQNQFHDRLTSLANDAKRPFYKEGRPHAAIHERLLTVIREKGLEPDVSGYTLESFRQEGRTCLQAVIAIPPNSGERYYADLDLDLGNPLQDVAGFLVHLGEVADSRATNHLDLQKQLAKGATGKFLYYRVT
jgi:hypothetical protein